MMGFNRGLFASTRLDHRTPKAVYQVLDAEFGFTFDPCPPNPTFDGLEVEWGGAELRQPALWSRGRQVDQKGMGRGPKRKDRSIPHRFQDGHSLVA